MIYDIDFSSVVKKLLPPKERAPRVSAWLAVLCYPLQFVRDSFFTLYRDDIIERTKYNGQIIVLEGIINKFLGLTVGPLAYIESKNIDATGVYVSPNGTINITSYIPLKGYEEDYIGVGYSLNEDNFIVWVPVGVPFVEAELRALIDKYKLFSTTYSIDTY